MDRFTHSMLQLAMHSPRNTDEEIERAIHGFAQRNGQTADGSLIRHFLRGRSHARQRRAANSETTVPDEHDAYLLGYTSKPTVPGFEPPRYGPLTTRLRNGLDQ